MLRAPKWKMKEREREREKKKEEEEEKDGGEKSQSICSLVGRGIGSDAAGAMEKRRWGVELPMNTNEPHTARERERRVGPENELPIPTPGVGVVTARRLPWTTGRVFPPTATLGAAG